jgi:hypothetical protein
VNDRIPQAPPRRHEEIDHWIAEGDFDRAIESLTQSADPDSLYLRAWLEYLRGGFAESESILTTHLESNPGDVDARFLRAYSRWLAGRLSSAREDIGFIKAGIGLETELVGDTALRAQQDLQALESQLVESRRLQRAEAHLNTVLITIGISVVAGLLVTARLASRAGRIT